MDYIKELQGFADRLRSMDPGMYFSRVYQTDNKSDDEQRQVTVLLQELQLAMESPSLLSAPPPGTVLHTGAPEKELGPALSHLCVALEKCLFFGAEGSMPDFWWVLDRSSESVTASRSGGGGGGGDAHDLGFDGEGTDADDGSGYQEGGVGGVRETKPPEPLAATVNRLTRVHTGHARCRAWARGLLGVDGASAEGELRRAAAVIQLATTRIATNELALHTKIEDRETKPVHGAGTISPSKEEIITDGSANVSGSDDDGGGGGDGDGLSSSNRVRAPTAAAAAAAAGRGPSDIPANEHDDDHPSLPPAPPPPSSLLPLWLRPDPKGASVLDDVCRSLVEFNGRLEESGLSIRPSLDHAWLDQESLAAVTTYAWPRFRRTRLRCYVRGAGLLAANGEYLLAETNEDEGEDEDGDRSGAGGYGLMLVGPNGCKICCQTATTVEKAATPFAAVGDTTPTPTVREESAAVRISGRPITNEDSGNEMQVYYPVEAQTTATAPAPAAPLAHLWCLLVPSTAASSDLAAMRSAYFCLGDGPLPPSRGWRTMETAEAPAPVLGFATQADDGGIVGSGSGHGGDEHQTRTAGEEEAAATTSFRAAVPPIGGNNDVLVVIMADDSSALSGATGVESSKVVAASSVETEALHGGKKNAGSAAMAGQGQLTRRRKRRRPPERIGGAAFTVGRESTKSVVVENGCPVEGGVWSAYGDCRDRGGDDWGRRGGREDRNGNATGYCYNASADDRGVDREGDNEAVAAFKAERWRLPAPSGELLSRANRSRELLHRTIEERAVVLADRRRQLQDKVAVAERDFHKVLEESTETTVGRVLAARPDLEKEAEVEVALAREAAAGAASSGGDGGGGGEMMVPSLEELVAEKAEELRARADSQAHEEATRPPPPSSSSAQLTTDKEYPYAAPQFGDNMLLPVVVADAGWPWPVDWFAAPRVPPPTLFREADILGVAEEEDFIDFGARSGFGSSGDAEGFVAGSEGGGGRVDPPVPYSIEVAAVEVVDAEGFDAAHVEYVLRVVYHERMQEIWGSNNVAATVPELPSRERNESDVSADSDRGTAELMSLVAAAKGLLQRTRVLSKRLNSLCALHPQLMWELAEGRRLRQEAEEAGGGIEEEPLEFPDPFELGTLEESILRVHRDKLTPRFKANSPTRKLSAQVGSYLSGLLHFLGVLEAAGETDVRSRMLHVLNDALSTCDRAGRKRRRSDFTLGVRIEDVAGGRLGSGGGDEDRLTVQKRSCMGCGRTIAAEFLGIKKDYSPCRFADGLFCRSCCHVEDRRVIPHRVVHHWDFHTHRVCKDARAFLDATRFLPVFSLPEVSPELFEEHQSLRTVRSQRKQLHLLRRAILKSCTSGSRLFDKLLEGRMHLAINPGLYSMEDLIGVKNGNLPDFLEEANESLAAHVVDGCRLCEARAARVCGICDTGGPIFEFQIGTVASCPSCDSSFHARCVEAQAPHHQPGKFPTASGSSKWWLDDQTEAGGNEFVCPKCKAVAPMAEKVLVR